MKQEKTLLSFIDTMEDGIKIAKELKCPQCGKDVYPVAGEIYQNGEIKPPHFECIYCDYKGFEHNFEKKLKEKK